MIGIEIKPTIGVGDAVQFSSAPENYFRATGNKLIDVSRPWFFDFNPYVIRTDETPETSIQMWNFSPTQRQWPVPELRKDKPKVYLSNAEIGASIFNVPVVLNRPRLYQFENEIEYSNRCMVLLQTSGISHSEMPERVLNHIVEKYGKVLFHIGPYGKLKPDVPHIETPTLWDLAKLISVSRMFIGLDSGPAWIASAYPDVIVKKLRNKPTYGVLKEWVPLEIGNIHSHWDDRMHQIFNHSEDDIGFTSSYRKI